LQQYFCSWAHLQGILQIQVSWSSLFQKAKQDTHEAIEMQFNILLQDHSTIWTLFLRRIHVFFSCFSPRKQQDFACFFHSFGSNNSRMAAIFWYFVFSIIFQILHFPSVLLIQLQRTLVLFPPTIHLILLFEIALRDYYCFQVVILMILNYCF